MGVRFPLSALKMAIMATVLKVVGAVVFLYLTWRRLYEDYEEKKLVAFAWVAVLAFFWGNRLAFGLINGQVGGDWWEWLVFWEKSGEILAGGYVGVLLVSVVWVWKNGWKLWSFLEDNVFGFLILCFFWLVAWGVGEGFGVEILRVAGMVLLAWLLTVYLVGRYRSFVWYRSGKKGFIFFWTNLVIWGSLALFTFWGKDGVEVGYLYLVLGLISLMGLFILGGVLSKE